MTNEAKSPGPAAVGVSFRRGGKVYDFAPNGVRIGPGDAVLARTERGVDIGEVVRITGGADAGEHEQPLKPLIRRATRDDLHRQERLRQREKAAAVACKSKIAEHDLPMKLIGADYTFDGERLIFFFSAEGRVDFRALVRDLAEAFHCRIELRQIGVRDEAKMVGGLGPCGRPLCCAQWLRDFDPVGIKAAKDQGLALNPAKISGICDRLMCCLRFEHEVYKELSNRLPKAGDAVKAQGRTGKVKGVQLLAERITVDFPAVDGVSQKVEVRASDLRRSRGYWLLLTSAGAEPFAPLGPPATREPPATQEPTAIMREPRRERRPKTRQPEPARSDAPKREQTPSEATQQEATSRPRRRPRRRTRSRRTPKDRVAADQPGPEAAGKAKAAEGQPRPQQAEQKPASPVKPDAEPATGERRKRRNWRRRAPRRDQSGGERQSSPPPGGAARPSSQDRSGDQKKE